MKAKPLFKIRPKDAKDKRVARALEKLVNSEPFKAAAAAVYMEIDLDLTIHGATKPLAYYSGRFKAEIERRRKA